MYIHVRWLARNRMAVGQRKKVTHTGFEEREATVLAHKHILLFLHSFIHLLT